MDKGECVFSVINEDHKLFLSFYTQNRNYMNIGLVLSGGMAKGAYQVGALKALNSFIPLSEIKYISGASVGVLNGYAYAAERLFDAEEMWKNICIEYDSQCSISQVLKSSALQNSILDSCDLKKRLSSIFYCSLFDYSGRSIIYKDISSVDPELIPQYLRASVSLPIYNRSVKLDDVAYFDGAMVDNIPVYPLVKHDPDYIICIYFDDKCYKFENPSFDKKIIKITFPSDSMFKQSVIFKKESIENMLKVGYDTASELLAPIFSRGYDNLEHIYSSIQNISNSRADACLRITGDVIVTNLNKITQRFSKRKVL